MKKSIKVMMLVVVAVLFSACSGNNTDKLETATYEVQLGGSSQTTILSHKEDTVKKIEQISEFDLSTFGLGEGDALDDKHKESIKKEVTAQFEEYKEADGLSFKTDFDKDTMTLNVSIDLDKADEKNLPIFLAGLTDPKSFKTTSEELLSQGYTEKK